MDQCQVSVYDSDERIIHLNESVNTFESDVESDASGRMFHKFHNSNVANTDEVDQSTSKRSLIKPY